MKNFEKWLSEVDKVENYFKHCDEFPASRYCENADVSLDCTSAFKQWALTDVEEGV